MVNASDHPSNQYQTPLKTHWTLIIDLQWNQQKSTTTYKIVNSFHKLSYFFLIWNHVDKQTQLDSEALETARTPSKFDCNQSAPDVDCMAPGGKNIHQIINIHQLLAVFFFWPCHYTVDGSEILHQLTGSLSHYLQGFIYARWLARFLPSTLLRSYCDLTVISCS